ncbi:MAG: tail fiber protein [Bacteroides sp.]|nr:tail fiber protein [Bacteroides sp.]MBD5343453.1 tail fiber protein [Bacteroides sp.]
MQKTLEKTLGNYLNQPNKDFPLDTETLDYLQQLTALGAIVGNIAGDKMVLYGCELSGDETRRGAGWVFVRTRSVPEGEVLYWEGGPIGSGMYLKQEDISVTANNRTYPKAYTRRSLAPGYGDENFKWEEFTDIKTIKDLLRENSELRAEIAGLQPAPLGVVQMWAGANVPDGYLLCNGQAYKQSDYPELFKALGTTFNNAVAADGKQYQTDPGFFRVPDLRGRFVVGLHDSDGDYTQRGSGGGTKSVALLSEHLPSHNHLFKDYYFAESQNKVKGNFDRIEINSGIGSGKVDYDNDYLQYYEHNTDSTGEGMAHENRPPYYVLAYIIRAK